MIESTSYTSGADDGREREKRPEGDPLGDHLRKRLKGGKERQELVARPEAEGAAEQQRRQRS